MPGGIFLFIEEGMCRSAFAAKIRFSFLSSDVSVFGFDLCYAGIIKKEVFLWNENFRGRGICASITADPKIGRKHWTVSRFRFFSGSFSVLWGAAGLESLHC